MAELAKTAGAQDEELRKSLRNIIQELAKPGRASKTSLEQCDKAVTDAFSYGTPAAQALADKARRAKALALARDRPKPRIAPDRREADKRRLTRDIIRMMLEVSRAAPKDKNKHDGKFANKKRQGLLDKLNKSNAKSADFFRKALAKMKLPPSRAPGPEIVEKYVPPPHGWKKLQEQRLDLMQARDFFSRRRDWYKRRFDDLAGRIHRLEEKKKKKKETITNDEKKMLKDAKARLARDKPDKHFGQHDFWANVLQKHIAQLDVLMDRKGNRE